MNVANLINEDEKIAAEALSHLACGMTHHLSLLPAGQPPAKPFMQRMQDIPLVNQSLSQITTAYAATKNYSNIVKYSAETVENGVKSLSKPVLDTIAPTLKPLDRFASNQLEKLQKSFPNYLNSSETQNNSPSALGILLENQEGIDTSQIEIPPPSPSHSYSTNGSNQIYQFPVHPYAANPLVNAPYTRPVGHVRTSSGPKRGTSRWNLNGVRKNLGSRVFTEEMTTGLKHCIHLLHQAAARIDHQIAFLTGYMYSFMSGDEKQENIANEEEDSKRIQGLPAIVDQVKRDIANILRKCVDIIGKYAAKYLPREARARVRGFIMALPSRWATINTATPVSSAPSSGASTPRTPPVEVQKVLTLANESSTMLKSISRIFSQAVDGAEFIIGNSALDSSAFPDFMDTDNESSQMDISVSDAME